MMFNRRKMYQIYFNLLSKNPAIIKIHGKKYVKTYYKFIKNYGKIYNILRCIATTNYTSFSHSYNIGHDFDVTYIFNRKRYHLKVYEFERLFNICGKEFFRFQVTEDYNDDIYDGFSRKEKKIIQYFLHTRKKINSGQHIHSTLSDGYTSLEKAL